GCGEAVVDAYEACAGHGARRARGRGSPRRQADRLEQQVVDGPVAEAAAKRLELGPGSRVGDPERRALVELLSALDEGLVDRLVGGALGAPIGAELISEPLGGEGAESRVSVAPPATFPLGWLVAIS